MNWPGYVPGLCQEQKSLPGSRRGQSALLKDLKHLPNLLGYSTGDSSEKSVSWNGDDLKNRNHTHYQIADSRGNQISCQWGRTLLAKPFEDFLEPGKIPSRLKETLSQPFFPDCHIPFGLPDQDSAANPIVPGKGIHSRKIVIMIRISRLSLNSLECPGDRLKGLSGHGQSQSVVAQQRWPIRILFHAGFEDCQGLFDFAFAEVNPRQITICFRDVVISIHQLSIRCDSLRPLAPAPQTGCSQSDTTISGSLAESSTARRYSAIALS